MFRQYCQRGSFSVLIPYRAHSAATVICLGADEIVMSKKGELGPIDATIVRGPYNPTEANTPNRLPVSVEDVNGYFALLDRVGCGRSEEKMEGFQELAKRVHPLALGAVNRLLEETKLVGLRLLSTRAKPFPEEENESIIKKLSSELYSHSHAINRSEAVKYLGLRHVKTAEDENLDNEMWSLYGEYRDLFEFEKPFMAEEHLVSGELDDFTWKDLPIACVETVGRLDIYRQSLRVRRLRQVPPTLTVNLSNLGLPAINFPTIPEGVNQQQIAALVQQAVQGIAQQSLNSAVQNAIRELVKNLPQTGFEHIVFDAGWKVVEQ
jgi:hypothetical protein